MAGTGQVLRRLFLNRAFSLIVIDAVFILGVTLLSPTFLSRSNFDVVILNMALPAIVTAVTVLLLGAGRFDLSIDGVAVVSGVIAGICMHDLGYPVVVAVAAGLGSGLLFGLVNGVLVESWGLNPLMTTLATWWIGTGAALGLTQGVSPYNFPAAFMALAQRQLFGFQMPIWYAVVVCGVLTVALMTTKFGAHIFATGGDREAARLNGIKTKRIGILLYAASGLAAAFAGVVFAGRLGSAPPNAFDGLALQAIAAAVIGGSSLAGGSGNIIGALFGLLLLSLLGDAAIYVGVSPYWEKAISGFVLMVAILWDSLSRSGRLHQFWPRFRNSRPSRRDVPDEGDLDHAG